MNGNYLILRADAGPEIGTGHLMRCLALAQAWKARGGNATFVTACETDALRQRLLDEGFEMVMVEHPYPHPDDWQRTSEILANYPGAWVVLDGYHFDEEYQLKIKQAGHKLLVIDDMAHLDHYYADIVLNQNIHAEELEYSCEPYTKLLLGTRYVLLRSEFLAWQGWKREIPEVARKVLVTLGGSDPDNVTLKVIKALQQVDLDGLEAIVVVGASNPHFQELVQAARESKLKIQIVRNSTNMPELMGWADVAISGGGTTCWELLFMGVPNLVLVLAENQCSIADQLDRIGAVLNLGWYKELSPVEIARTITELSVAIKRRSKMAQRGRELVDGEGADRVLMHVKNEKLRLRKAREEDSRLLWEWANDPQVRAAAFSPDPISWEEHVKWFINKLNNDKCFIFVALDDKETPVGQVRFDMMNEKEAEIDVSIDRNRRGSGYGTLLIKKGIEEIFRSTSIRIVHAFIKLDNVASIKVFEKAGFKRLGIDIVRGNMAVHFAGRRENG